MGLQLFEPVGARAYLQAAIQAGEFIRRHEIKTPQGKHWAIGTVEGKEPDAVEASFLTDRSLYSGAAGIGTFFVQLFEVTEDASWLHDAVAAGDFLTATYDKSLAANPGFHSGAAGEGAFLGLLFDKTGDERYREQALAIGDDVRESATRDGAGIKWSGVFDFMGDAGAVLYWIELAGKTGEQRFLGFAKEVLDRVLALGSECEDGSTYWKLFDPHEYFPSVPAGGIVPNFAHGTAGIVYLLARYYEATGESAYLDQAIRGYRFLKRIAIEDGDASIVPYIYLDQEKRAYDVLYLGYCHGPVGDGIAVRELYRATGDVEFLEFHNRLTNALVRAGVPERRSPGYWNDCLCCGSAGVLLHFLAAAELDPAYLPYAQRTAAKSVTDAYRDEDGLRWYNAWTRVKPWDVDAHLGLYVGAAGSASALLSAYAKEAGKAITPLVEFA